MGKDWEPVYTEDLIAIACRFGATAILADYEQAVADLESEEESP